MMKRYSLAAFFLVLLLVFQASTGALQHANAYIKRQSDAPPIQTALQSSGTVSAIIELDSEPVVMQRKRVMPMALRNQQPDLESTEARAYAAQIDREQADFKARAAQVSPRMQVRTQLRVLANAVAVDVPGTELAAIALLPGVKRVNLVKTYHAMLDSSVPLINAPAMWDRLGGVSVAGEGMKIAILDTGIDISNPLFADNGYTAPAGFPRFNNNNQDFTNNKVIVAKSFLGNSTSAQDQNGHGSNVAGIAAGNAGTLSPLGPIAGVAPRAFLGNYRVLDRTGSGSDSGIASAIEAAVLDGFDVISLSLGGDPTNALDFLASTVENAVSAGKIVTIAAGNDGNGGTDDEMTIASPGLAPSAITVAASSNAHIIGPVVTVTGPQPAASSLANMGATSGNAVPLDNSFAGLPLVDPDPQGRGCNGLPAGSLNGKVALIERGPANGGCSFTVKVATAAAAGAKAVIIFNYDQSENPAQGGESYINMEVGGTTIPSVFIQHSNGAALRNFLRTNPNATLNLAPLGSSSAVADVLAGFSSRGPSSLEGLKPDIAAPGVIIYSAAITTANSSGVSDPSGFDAISGTSQATPHIAGAAALVKQLHPSWTPVQVKSALMSSATRAVFTTTSQTDAQGVLATGAGRVDLSRAALVNATFQPASLGFGINKLKKKAVSLNQDMSITNTGDSTTTLTFSVQQLDPDDGVTVALNSTSATLAPGQKATLNLTIDAKKKAPKRDYTGYVNATDSTGQTLHVPYWVRFVKKK
jgi:minor extracellular serine protease Vpr